MVDWYKRDPVRALRGMHGMSFDVIGCYNVIIDLIYIYGGPIPNDPRWIASQGSASTKSVQAWIRHLIAQGRLTETDGMLHDERALTTLRERADKTSTAAKNGALGGCQKAVNSLSRTHAANKTNEIALANASPREEESRKEKKIDDDGERGRVDIVRLVNDCASAAGLRLADPGKIAAAADIVREWLAAGADPPGIIAAVRGALMVATDTIHSFRYFEKPVLQAIAKERAKSDECENAIRSRSVDGIRNPMVRAGVEREARRVALHGEGRGS